MPSSQCQGSWVHSSHGYEWTPDIVRMKECQKCDFNIYMWWRHNFFKNGFLKIGQFNKRLEKFMTVIWFSKIILPVIILKEDLDLFVAVINQGQSPNSLPARLSGQFEVISGHWSHCHQSLLDSFMWASLQISSNMYYLFLQYRSWTCLTDIGKGR